PRRPATPPTSRLTVDGALPIRLAMARKDSPAASPARISSRSLNDNRSDERGRRRERRDGAPPAAASTLLTVLVVVPTARATCGWVSPPHTRSRISSRSARHRRLPIGLTPSLTAHLPPVSSTHPMLR